MAEAKPLVLDVDGTLLRTDLLYESFWAGLGRAPIATLRACLRHLRQPARLKRALARIGRPRLDLMPVEPEIADLAREGRANGREVVLASASDRELVGDLAALHCLSPRIFASDGERNLKGPAKARALVAAFGEGGFDYAGNHRADRPVWSRAENALIVGDGAGLAPGLARQGRSVQIYGQPWRRRDLLRAMRPHQWVKNVLMLLPAIGAHDFTFATFALVLWGMAAFSALASAIYIVNDLLDLEADRLHPTKRHRPFASGAVPIPAGMAAAAGLVLVALATGAALGPAFLAVLLVYAVLSLAYSLRLKRMRWLDILVLAVLYTLRVVAGAEASDVHVSAHMLAFILPVFVTLGCVKRLTELAYAEGGARLPGRGYGWRDRGAILNLAVGAMVAALAVYALYVASPQAQALYPTRWLLWLVLVPLALWLLRMVLLGYKGQQDFDPIVFAMRDRLGIGLLLLALSLMFWAAGLWAQWLG